MRAQVEMTNLLQKNIVLFCDKVLSGNQLLSSGKNANSVLNDINQLCKEMTDLLRGNNVVIEECSYHKLVSVHSIELIVLLTTKDLPEAIKLCQPITSVLLSVWKKCLIDDGTKINKKPDALILLNVIGMNNAIANCLSDKNEIGRAKTFFKFCFKKYKLLKTLHSSFDLSAMNNAFLSQYYPNMATIACKQNNIKQAIKYTTLGHSFFVISAGEQSKFMSAAALFQAYSTITLWHLQNKKYEYLLSWVELTNEMAEEVQSLLSENPDITLINMRGVQIKFENEPYLKKMDDSKKVMSICLIKAKEELLKIYSNTLSTSLNKNGEVAKCNLNQETSDIEIEFIDLKKGMILSGVFSNSKLNFRINNKCETYKVCVNVQDINAKSLYQLLEKYWKSVASHDNKNYLEQTSSFFKTEQDTSKEEKKKRHENNQSERIAEQESLTKISKSDIPDIKSTPSKKSKVVWNDVKYNQTDDERPFYLVHGKTTLVTFSTFNPKAFVEVPNQFIVDKFTVVAERGRVLNQDNSKGKQGYVFYKQDQALSKYGKNYVCKLKIKGQGGDHRFIGKKVTIGVITKIDDESNKRECELIEFDKYIHKGH